MLGLSLRSLRAKLLLFSLVLIVVPGVIVAVIALTGARRALRDAIGRQLAEVAHDTASELTELLERQRTNLATWARQDVMREVLVGDVDKNVARFLTSVRESDAGYVDLLCTDRDGRVVAATDPFALNQVYADAAWYRAASGGGEYLAGPIRPTVDAAPVMEFAAPIPAPEASGETIGVLRVRYDLNRATKLMNRIRRSSEILRLSVQVLVLDADGVVIVEALGPGQRPLLGANLRALGWRVAQPGAIAAHPRFVREGRARALVGLTPVATPGLGWVVLVMEPVHAAYAPVYRLQRRLSLLLLAVLLAGSGVAVLVAERMSRPLRELTSATQEIVRVGETRQTVPVRSHDEIGQLANAFNTMAGQLKQAEDHLVEAAKFAFVGEVAAGVAHEVRTPLGILRSAAQILGRSLPAERPESAELIDMIIGEVDRLDRVVAGLLDLARPHEPVVEPTSLAGILMRALEFIELQAREKGVVVHRVLDAVLPPARCDPEQIYQVALNLLVNALQLVPAGGTVTVRTSAAGPGRVAFEVADDGPGIAPDVLPRIFAPFFSLRPGGTGLGLALVQRTVLAHHGAVTAESTVGRGTTFRVELPAAEETR
jgi:two-component system, NtrC family, sensor histidine kinase HydH